ncbi:MAG: hypothetical protein WC438_00630 [Candidatus Pacearchaeota archaeon]
MVVFIGNYRDNNNLITNMAYNQINIKNKSLDFIQIILILIMFIFGILIIYQLIKKILGGSWNSEDIIVALLIFNLGCLFTIILNLAKLNSDHEHLEKQFYYLAKDFKEHIANK